jgi:hypothetical protein
MSEHSAPFVYVTEGERVSYGHAPSADTAARAVQDHTRARWGDVIFDHIRGTIDRNAEPLVEPHPYLLVLHYRDFDWTSQHVTEVKEFATADAMIAEGERLVAEERARGSSNLELWELFGVRVRERRPRPPRRDNDVTGRLVDDLRSAPDDDGPRLVWADAVGGERCELVVIQTDLERGGLSPREAIVRRKRQRELLARHGVEWSGLGGWATHVSYRRGFVDAAQIPLATFLDHAVAILERAPLLSALTVIDLGDADGIKRLCAHPAFPALRGLAIVGALKFDYVRARLGEGGWRSTAGEAVAQHLVAGRGLANLRALGIEGSGPQPQATTLLDDGHFLQRVERLGIAECADARSQVRMLRRGRLAALRALDAGSAPAELMAAIPPSVVELRIDLVDDARLAALADAPVAATLERLTIERARITGDRLAAFPNLRALTVHGEVRDIDALLQLERLRELAPVVQLAEDPTRRLAKALGPQLDLLDLRNNGHALRHVNELKQYVAGELLVAPPRYEGGSPYFAAPERGLLRVGPTTQMPWWDHVRL